MHRLQRHRVPSPLRLFGIDCSAGAVRLARLNARRLLSGVEDSSLKGNNRRSSTTPPTVGSGYSATTMTKMTTTTMTKAKNDIQKEPRDMSHSRATTAQVQFTQADLFALNTDALPSRPVDGPLLLVSNPPYVSDSEYAQLEPSVRLWEDRRALVGGRQEPRSTTTTKVNTSPTKDSKEFTNPDGLLYFHILLELWLSMGQRRSDSSTATTQLATWERVSCLKADLSDPPALPSLALEYGGGHQTDALLKLFRPHLTRVEILVDYYEQDRCLLGYS